MTRGGEMAMTKSDDMEFLVGREKHERKVAALTIDPVVKQVHERFAEGYANLIVDLNSGIEQASGDTSSGVG